MNGPGQVAGADAGAAPTGSMRTPWIVLAVLFAVYCFSSIDRAVFSIVAQPIKEELGLADWELGLLSGFAFSLLFLAFGLPMARLADTRNRVTLLTFCIACWSVMTALCGLTVNFAQMCLARMGVSVGEAGCLPTSHSLITDYFPPNMRTKALAIYGLGYPFGSLLGTALAGVLLERWGWRASFAIIGLPGILVALGTWAIVREPVRGRFDAGLAERGREGPQTYLDVSRLLWRTPALRQMLFGLTAMSFATSPTATFLAPYLIRRFPISYQELGFIVAVSMMLGASLSTFFGGLITQRLAQSDQRWYMWFPAITIAIGAPIYVAAFAQSNWQTLAALMFVAALINATYLAPSYTVMHNSIPSGGRAKAAVIVQILMTLVGLSLGGLLGGAAIDLIAGFRFGPDFLASCPGGHAAKGAAAAVDIACRGAVVDATQWVLMATLAMTLWPAWHFYLAGRHLRAQGAQG